MAVPRLPRGAPLFPVVHVEPLDVTDVHRRLHVLLALDDDGLDVAVQIGTCVDHFTDLLDCPSTITPGQYLKGNPGGTDLIFGALPSATPGGSDTQVQFNDAGVFGGMVGVKWTKATKKLQLGEGGDPLL